MNVVDKPAEFGRFLNLIIFYIKSLLKTCMGETKLMDCLPAFDDHFLVRQTQKIFTGRKAISSLDKP